ncbi:MAG: hypothetical protein M0P95_01415 [Sulfuritalea sp.]|jgi:hypothetical protein|nr:hypothetical protein [Sulfuritalea sp.]
MGPTLAGLAIGNFGYLLEFVVPSSALRLTDSSKYVPGLTGIDPWHLLTPALHAGGDADFADA